MTYNPLPNCLTIKNSTIHGLGVFATSFISKGTDLGITHHIIDEDNLIIRRDFGGFINHNEEPNCELKRTFTKDGEIYTLYTIRHIQEGEEITLRYKYFNTDFD